MPVKKLVAFAFLADSSELSWVTDDADWHRLNLPTTASRVLKHKHKSEADSDCCRTAHLLYTAYKEYTAQVGNGIELDTVGRQFEPYLWRPCGVTWDVVPEQS